MKILFRILLPLSLLLLAACGPSPFDEPPLHDAAMRGNLDTVKELIKSGVEVDSRNSEGATALHWAAFKGQTDVARYLLAKGADVNAHTRKGSTPLRLATTHEQHEVIKLLKAQGGVVE